MTAATPIRCYGCGTTGWITHVTAGLRCTCGSTDLDLHEPDPPARSGGETLDAAFDAFPQRWRQDLPGWSEYVGPPPGPNVMDNGYPGPGQRCSVCKGSGYDLSDRNVCRNCQGTGIHTPPTARPEPVAVPRHKGPSTQTTVPFMGKQAQRPPTVNVVHPRGLPHDIVFHSHEPGGGIISTEQMNDPRAGEGKHTRYYAEADPEHNLGYHPSKEQATRAIADHFGWDAQHLRHTNETTGEVATKPFHQAAARRTAAPAGSVEEHIKATTPGYSSSGPVGPRRPNQPFSREDTETHYPKADTRSPATSYRSDRDYTTSGPSRLSLPGADCPTCGNDPTHLVKDQREQAWWSCPNCGPLANVDKTPEVDPYDPGEAFQPSPKGFKAAKRTRWRKPPRKTGRLLSMIATVAQANPGLGRRQAVGLARAAATRYRP